MKFLKIWLKWQSWISTKENFSNHEKNIFEEITEWAGLKTFVLLVTQTLWNLRTIENDLRTAGHFELCFWICHNQNCHQSTFWKNVDVLENCHTRLWTYVCYFLTFCVSSTDVIKSYMYMICHFWKSFLPPFEKFFTPPSVPSSKSTDVGFSKIWFEKRLFFVQICYSDWICGLVGKNIVEGGKKLLESG